MFIITLYFYSSILCTFLSLAFFPELHTLTGLTRGFSSDRLSCVAYALPGLQNTPDWRMALPLWPVTLYTLYPHNTLEFLLFQSMNFRENEERRVDFASNWKYAHDKNTRQYFDNTIWVSLDTVHWLNAPTIFYVRQNADHIYGTPDRDHKDCGIWCSVAGNLTNVPIFARTVSTAYSHLHEKWFWALVTEELWQIYFF